MILEKIELSPSLAPTTNIKSDSFTLFMSLGSTLVDKSPI